MEFFCSCCCLCCVKNTASHAAGVWPTCRGCQQLLATFWLGCPSLCRFPDPWRKDKAIRTLCQAHLTRKMKNFCAAASILRIAGMPGPQKLLCRPRRCWFLPGLRRVLCQVYFTLCLVCLTLSPMNKSEAVAFFGSQSALAKALGVSRSSVSEWGDVPIGRQFQLEVLTAGALKADHENRLEDAGDLPCGEATS